MAKVYRRIYKINQYDVLKGEWGIEWFFASDTSLPSDAKAIQILARKEVYPYEIHGGNTQKHISSEEEVEEWLQKADLKRQVFMSNIHGGTIFTKPSHSLITSTYKVAPQREVDYLEKVFTEELLRKKEEYRETFDLVGQITNSKSLNKSK